MYYVWTIDDQHCHYDLTSVIAECLKHPELFPSNAVQLFIFQKEISFTISGRPEKAPIDDERVHWSPDWYCN